MTPDALASLHRVAFTQERPWAASEFADLLTNPHVEIVTHPHGFAMTCTVAGESELLTLAVNPAHQRKGIGRALVTQWLSASAAREAFLEVAADNTAACALYISMGFAEAGRRPSYYARKNAAAADAIVMRLALTTRPHAFSGPPHSESG